MVCVLSALAQQEGHEQLAAALQEHARLVNETKAIQNYGGLAFLGQAGVTLGFSVIISERFPGVGETLSTIIVAAVALNQIVGPVAFRYALGKAGEIGMRQGE